MGRHRNTTTGVVVNVDDSKDDRYASSEWEPATEKSEKPTSKRGTRKSSD